MILNQKNEKVLEELFLVCKKFKPDINIKLLKKIALSTIKYLMANKEKRKDLFYNQELENIWYKNLNKNIIKYEVYNDDKYISELWACWIVYSRKYLKALINKKSFPPKGIIKEFGNINTVLDLGCGFGLTSSGLKEIFSNAKVYGTNIKNTLQYKVAKYYSKKYNFKIISNINNIKENIDLIFASEYFEHLENPIDELTLLIKKFNPKNLLIANSFGTIGIGHFYNYSYNNKLYDGKKMSKIFNDKLKELGYKKIKTKLWNNRPSYFKKIDYKIKELINVNK